MWPDCFVSFNFVVTEKVLILAPHTDLESIIKQHIYNQRFGLDLHAHFLVNIKVHRLGIIHCLVDLMFQKDIRNPFPDLIAFSTSHCAVASYPCFIYLAVSNLVWYVQTYYW